MTVDALFGWIAAHPEGLIASLLDGGYRPQLMRRYGSPNQAAGEAGTRVLPPKLVALRD